MTARRDDIPLVFLNAFPLDAEQWEPLLAVLDAQVGDIITFDPPGIGEMPATEEDPSLGLIADAAVAAMREVTGSRDALWVGCSMGGYVAMAVLERHPDAVAGIGLLATRASADSEAAKARRLEAATAAIAHDGLLDPGETAHALLGAFSREREAVVASTTANVARQRGQGVAWCQLAMAARPERLEVLRGADVPAFVARGDQDELTTDEEACDMADALGVELTRIGAAGHLLAVEAPEAVARLIAELASAAHAQQ